MFRVLCNAPVEQRDRWFQMVARTFYGYAPDALEFDPISGDVELEPGFTPGNGRARFELTDDDNFGDGDAGSDEVGDDLDQVATVYGPGGGVLGDGQIYVEEVRWYETASGDLFTITVFEIGGQVVGYVPSEPLLSGESYTYTGSTEPGFKPGGSANNDFAQNYNFYVTNSVACFGPGTMIATQNGEIPVEWLDTSDMVLTRDDGFQPILWIGRTQVPQGYFERYPKEYPVRIAPGTLGPNCPTHPLSVTGDHRIMIQAAEAELMFASAEVLAPAKAWIDAGRATRVEPHNTYTVTHILLETHQLIMAEGAWVESMFTGKETLRRLGSDQVAHLETLLGADLQLSQTARPCLTRKEAIALISLLPSSFAKDQHIDCMRA